MKLNMRDAVQVSDSRVERGVVFASPFFLPVGKHDGCFASKFFISFFTYSKRPIDFNWASALSILM